MLAIWAALWLVTATALIVDLARPSHRTFWRRFLAGGMLMASGAFLSYASTSPVWGNFTVSLEAAGGISMAVSVAIMAGTRLVTAVQQANPARARHSHRDQGL